MAPSEGSLVNSSFSSLSFLVALQLFSRLFTSILNQALFRLASPGAFGTAAIQFELILSTILFLSREGVRNAILRTNTEAADEHAKTTNLTFLPFLLGVPLALLTFFVYITYASDEVRQQPHLTMAVGIYAIAALIELLSEPMHNMTMLQLKTHVRVRAEGLGITYKSIITLLVLVYDARRGRDDLALVAFAVGQLTYSVVVLLCYASAFGTSWLRTLGRWTPSTFSFDAKLLRLSLTMTSQSVIKHFLTEGDKLVLSFFSQLDDQGGYAIAVNYGSLIARIVFQPLEETLRVFFSKLLSITATEKTAKKKVKQSSDALIGLLSVQLMFSFLVVIFGSAYLPILLPILLPQRYLATSAPRILAAWIYYIPVLALNGGLEAFLSSAASPTLLNRQSRWMIAFSVIYVSTAILFYRLGFGDVSLIYANIVNLAVRIAYCLRFASIFFKENQPSVDFNWKSAFPPMSFVVMSAASAILIWLSERKLNIDALIRGSDRYAFLEPVVLLHIILGASLAASCLSVWWFSRGHRLISALHHGKVE